MNQTERRKAMTPSAWPERLDKLASWGLLRMALTPLRDERQRKLVILRHGFGLSWPAVRREAARLGMPYSERQLYRIYTQALQVLEDLVRER